MKQNNNQATQQAEEYAKTMPYPDDDGISLVDYWRIIAKYKWLVLSVITLVTTIATVIAFTKTPIYRAEVLLAPVNKSDQDGGLSNLASQFGGLASLSGVNLRRGRNATQEIIATLQSRVFTQQFIQDNKLLPLLFKNRWNTEKQSWIGEKPNNVPSMWIAYKKFNAIRSISENKKTGLVTLAIEWTDPNLAAKWANQLVSTLNARLRADAIEESEKNLKFLRDQIEKTSVLEIQQSMFGLVEGEMKKAMLANVSDEYAFRVIDPAVPPEIRTKPNRKLIISIGVVFGVMLGIFLAVIVNVARNLKAKKAQEIG